MKRKKGFTLIELIATMAVMSIVAVMVSNIFSSTVKMKDFQGANCDTVQNLKLAQANLYNDIRRSVSIIDPVETVAGTGVYAFPDGGDINIIHANSFCTARSLRPLIYMKEIDNSFVYYAYSKSLGTLLKMTIPVDTTPSVPMYYPDCYDLSSATQHIEWDELTDDQVNDYNTKPPKPENVISQDKVVINNIVITEKIGSTNKIYNSFTFVNAFKDIDGNNKVLLMTTSTNQYFIVKLTSKQISYYGETKDIIIAKGIMKDGIDDAITITPNTTANITVGKYYEIHIDGKIGKSYNSIDTRVSMVNYGIGGGI